MSQVKEFLNSINEQAKKNAAFVAQTDLQDFLNSKGLTARESDIAVKVASGLGNKEIGTDANISEKTVKFHLTNLYKKMEVQSRAQLIVTILPFLLKESHGK